MTATISSRIYQIALKILLSSKYLCFRWQSNLRQASLISALERRLTMSLSCYAPISCAIRVSSCFCSAPKASGISLTLYGAAKLLLLVLNYYAAFDSAPFHSFVHVFGVPLVISDGRYTYANARSFIRAYSPGEARIFDCP